MKSKFFKKIIFFISLSCLLFSTSVFADIYIIDGEYEYQDTIYNVDSNGKATKQSSNEDENEEDDTEFEDIDDDENNSDSRSNRNPNSPTLPDDPDTNTHGDDGNYHSEDNIIINESFTETDAEVIIPFSDLESISGDGTQFDLFGICLNKHVESYAGNRNYLGNTDLLEEFYSWLEKAKYDTSQLKIIIEKIKNILGVISGTIQGKEYMQFDEDVLSAVEARQIMVATIKVQKTLEVIFFCIGVLMMVYGFGLLLAWIFDKSALPLMSETGLLENGMLGLITFNHLRADDDCIEKGSVTFIKCAILAFAVAGIGMLLITPTFRELLGEGIKGFANIFGEVGE